MSRLGDFFKGTIVALVLGLLFVLFIQPSYLPQLYAQTLPQMGAQSGAVFNEVGSLQLKAGERGARSVVIDQNGGYAYIGTWTNPGIVVKINLSNFTESGSLTLDPTAIGLSSAVVDTAAGFAYFATYTSPGIIVKVRLSNLTRVGNLTLAAGENNPTCAVIDVNGGFAYFGTGTSPGIVVRVRLSNFTEAGHVTLNSGENSISTGAIDVGGGYAYFGMDYPGRGIARIRLSDFRENGSISTPRGIVSAVVDTVRGYALFGTNTSPSGWLEVVRLSNFYLESESLLTYGEQASPIIDQEGGSVYFGTTSGIGTQAFVEKISLTSYQETATLTTNTGEYGLFSGVIDNLRGYAYFGTDTDPGRIVKVQIAGPPSVPTGLTATPTAGAIKLKWNVPQSNGRYIVGYKIYRATASGQETFFASPGNQPSYNDAAVSVATTYYYTVSAVNSMGEGITSNEASARANAPLPSFLPLIVFIIGCQAIAIVKLLNRKRVNTREVVSRDANWFSSSKAP